MLCLLGGSKLAKEATITIGGVKLSEAQSMTVRVAISNMLMELEEPKFFQQLGETAPLYKAGLAEVQLIIHKEINK